MYTYNQTDNNINNMPVGLPFGGEVAVMQAGQAGQLKKNRESTNDVGQVINQQTPNDG